MEREAQPVAFGSIPAAMWWAFATLTTVGYGDVTPITAAGRVFGASITVVGVGMVALPTAILASAFSERLRLNTQRYRFELSEALHDGVLTDEELKQLKALRENLNLSDDLAAEIVATMMRDRKNIQVTTVDSTNAEATHCPYCKRPLDDGHRDEPMTD